MRSFFALILLCFSASLPLHAADGKTETVILVTIDGLRWQEVYRGLDDAYIESGDYIAHKKTLPELKASFASGDASSRRAALMPFFWGMIAKNGQLYGDRDLGNAVSVSNPYHFSYPGYSEILTGIPDPRVDSNDKVLNPNRTVLEWLNDRKGHKGKVAAFGSWDVFPYIINEGRSHVPVNAGFEAYHDVKSPTVDFLNELQDRVPSPWDTVRLDAFTMGFAREALKAKKLDMVYISLGETDDFAHDGHYDQYIKAAHRADMLIADLWQQVQADKRYAGKTTLIVTTDHGRGSAVLSEWTSHGHFPYTKEDGTEAISDFKGDGEVWIAVLGPDTPAKGVVEGGDGLVSAQIAATAARALGLTYTSDHPDLTAGAPIPGAIRD